MINVDFSSIKLEDGKRKETIVYYELQVDDKNYKEKVKEEFNKIIDNNDDLSYVTFGVDKCYRTQTRRG